MQISTGETYAVSEIDLFVSEFSRHVWCSSSRTCESDPIALLSVEIRARTSNTVAAVWVV